MTSNEFNWEPTAASEEDQRLIDAYVEIGVPLDSLVYTSAFKKLTRAAGRNPTIDSDLRKTYLRLLTLRKQSLLPRIYRGPSEHGDADNDPAVAE